MFSYMDAQAVCHVCVCYTQIPGLLEGSTLAALSGGLGPGASGPWSTSGVTGQDKVVGAPMNTQQLPVANRSVVE